MRVIHMFTHPKRPLEALCHRPRTDEFHQGSMGLRDIAELQTPQLELVSLQAHLTTHRVQQPVDFFSCTVIGRRGHVHGTVVQTLHVLPCLNQAWTSSLASIVNGMEQVRDSSPLALWAVHG